MKDTSNIYMTDSSFIYNKLGEDDVSYNSQVKKHKVTKISVINDYFGVPLSINISTGSIHDSSILDMHIDELYDVHPKLFESNKNIMLADSAYDSTSLKLKFKEKNFGKLLTSRNKRNTKDKSKLDKMKLTLPEFMLLQKRISVEHLILKFKKMKKLEMRYEKKSSNYKHFAYFAALSIVLNKTNNYLI